MGEDLAVSLGAMLMFGVIFIVLSVAFGLVVTL